MAEPATAEPTTSEPTTTELTTAEPARRVPVVQELGPSLTLGNPADASCRTSGQTGAPNEILSMGPRVRRDATDSNHHLHHTSHPEHSTLQPAICQHRCMQIILLPRHHQTMEQPTTCNNQQHNHTTT